MRKIHKILLITLAIIVIAYGIYFFMGRPALPLPAYHYKLSPGNQLYDIVKATESDQVTLSLVSNGKIEAVADEKNLADITYTPQSLNNAISLASKFAIPEESQNKIFNVVRFLPRTRTIPFLVENFFYHVIRLRFTVVVSAE